MPAPTADANPTSEAFTERTTKTGVPHVEAHELLERMISLNTHDVDVSEAMHAEADVSGIELIAGQAADRKIIYIIKNRQAAPRARSPDVADDAPRLVEGNHTQ